MNRARNPSAAVFTPCNAVLAMLPLRTKHDSLTIAHGLPPRFTAHVADREGTHAWSFAPERTRDSLRTSLDGVETDLRSFEQRSIPFDGALSLALDEHVYECFATLLSPQGSAPVIVIVAMTREGASGNSCRAVRVAHKFALCSLLDDGEGLAVDYWPLVWNAKADTFVPDPDQLGAGRPPARIVLYRARDGHRRCPSGSGSVQPLKSSPNQHRGPRKLRRPSRYWCRASEADAMTTPSCREHFASLFLAVNPVGGRDPLLLLCHARSTA